MDFSHQLAFRISQFCRAHAIGRSKTYQEIKKGRLQTYKVGRSTYISKDAAEAWMTLCQSETPSHGKKSA